MLQPTYKHLQPTKLELVASTLRSGVASCPHSETVSTVNPSLFHQVASKAKKRCTELLQLIELDTVQFQLFDLPPVKEYDLYISSFGRTNAQQVSPEC